jgi:hypothetical protein
MKTPLAEIDFLDVFLNRRILVVLLPALEKSPPELTNLGRIVVASIKATMAVGLGADVEGDWRRVIDAKPTAATSPYMCILDEYGYYAVEGFAVVPAQARSLGFSAIFAGQDLPAFEKASKPEAQSTLANTTTKFCGYLQCTETYEYFRKLAGEGLFSKVSGFNNRPDLVSSQSYMDNTQATVERQSRVSMDVLKNQLSGQWHLFLATRIVQIQSFFSNPDKVKKLRTNHFLEVHPPSDEHRKAVEAALRGVWQKEAPSAFKEGLSTELWAFLDHHYSSQDRFKDPLAPPQEAPKSSPEADPTQGDEAPDPFGVFKGDEGLKPSPDIDENGPLPFSPDDNAGAFGLPDAVHQDRIDERLWREVVPVPPSDEDGDEGLKALKSALPWGPDENKRAVTVRYPEGVPRPVMSAKQFADISDTVYNELYRLTSDPQDGDGGEGVSAP